MTLVIWSRTAHRNLQEIGDYIAQGNPGAAARVIGRILNAAERLGEVPTGRPGRVAGTYEKVVGSLPYIVSYRLGPERDVYIIRVIHGAQRWPETL